MVLFSQIYELQNILQKALSPPNEITILPKFLKYTILVDIFTSGFQPCRLSCFSYNEHCVQVKH